MTKKARVAEQLQESFTPSVEQTQAVLEVMVYCDRPTTVNAIAKKLAIRGLGAAQVQHLVDVLEALPYAEVARSASGRLAGLSFVREAVGACGVTFIRRSPGTVVYHREGKVVAQVHESDLAAQKARLAELAQYASEHGLPLLAERGTDHASAVAPFVQLLWVKALGADAVPRGTS